jgi:Uma2 family endonuclease
VEPPDVAIEIVSPRQSVTALVRRCLWYVAKGVRLTLVIDPHDESVLLFRPDTPPIALRGSDAIDLTEVLPEFRLTVEDLFASLYIE